MSIARVDGRTLDRRTSFEGNSMTIREAQRAIGLIDGRVSRHRFFTRAHPSLRQRRARRKAERQARKAGRR